MVSASFSIPNLPLPSMETSLSSSVAS
jgi:hypothetical protein